MHAGANLRRFFFVFFIELLHQRVIRVVSRKVKVHTRPG